jgi:hypothetical protein
MLRDIVNRIELRLAALGVSATRASSEAGLSQDAIRNMLRRRETEPEAGVSTVTLQALAPVLKTTAAWLLDATGPEDLEDLLVPIIGYVGADPSGRIRFADGQRSGDLVPVPPGGSERAVALEVRGQSMPGFADEGSLVYFEDQHSTPTRDMYGQVVVLQLTSGEVLIKRLFKGSKPGLYDLGSGSGPVIEDVEIEWAAEICAIVPPLRARKIILRGGATEVA